MKFVRSSLQDLPLLWVFFWFFLFLCLCSFPASLKDLAWFILSFVLSYGFWSFFIGLSKWGFEKHKATLLLSFPLFLFSLGLLSSQIVHKHFFGQYISKSRLDMIRLNWNIVLAEVVKMLTHLEAWVIPAGVSLLFLLFYLFLKYTFSYFSTSSKKHFWGKAFCTGLWFIWVVVFALGLHYPGQAQNATPSVAGHFLFKYVFDQLSTKGGLLSSDEISAPDWVVRRKQEIDFSSFSVDIHGKASFNVILVLLESVRADHLSVGGYHRKTSPFLEGLTKNPNVFYFSKAFSNATGSYFSLLSLVSGLDFKRDQKDFERAPLLWDYLKPLGYHSFLITQSVGYPRYLLDRFFKTPGLDFYRDVGQEKLAEFYQKQKKGSHFLIKRFLKQFYEEAGVERDDQFTFLALKQHLKERPKEKFFFGVWELECTHIPYCYSDAFDQFKPSRNVLLGKTAITTLVNDYDNALLSMDHFLKQLWGVLEAEDLLKNTVIFITSDHGEAFLDHGQLFHGETLYSEEARVPFFIYLPDDLKKQIHFEQLAMLRENQEHPIALVDLLPTLVDLIQKGKKPLADYDGRSLLRPLDSNEIIYISNASRFPGRETLQPNYATIDFQMIQRMYNVQHQLIETYDLSSHATPLLLNHEGQVSGKKMTQKMTQQEIYIK